MILIVMIGYDRSLIVMIFDRIKKGADNKSGKSAPGDSNSSDGIVNVIQLPVFPARLLRAGSLQ